MSEYTLMGLYMGALLSRLPGCSAQAKGVQMGCLNRTSAIKLYISPSLRGALESGEAHVCVPEMVRDTTYIMDNGVFGDGMGIMLWLVLPLCCCALVQHMMK